MLDVAVAVFPGDVGAAAWRFGALGIVARSITTPLVGLLIALSVALILDHQRTANVIGVLAGIAAGLLLLCLPLFIFDAVKLRWQVEDGARASFAVSATLASLKLLAAVVVAGMAAASGTRGARRIAAIPKKSAPLIWRDQPADEE